MWLRVLGAPRAKADGRREARRWARFAAPISKIRTPGLKPPLVCAFEQALLRQKGMSAPASSFFHVFPQWGCCWSHLPTADARLKCQQASNVLSGDADASERHVVGPGSNPHAKRCIIDRASPACWAGYHARQGDLHGFVDLSRTASCAEVCMSTATRIAFCADSCGQRDIPGHESRASRKLLSISSRSREHRRFWEQIGNTGPPRITLEALN